ncbi:nickel-dependent lactate racemase [Chloroflexota bacterium]
MSNFSLPYGSGNLEFRLPNKFKSDIITPRAVPGVPDPEVAVKAALKNPLEGINLEGFQGIRSVAIAVNDKTRPVPNHYLLPPILEQLIKMGIKTNGIHIIIATGTHTPMVPEEFDLVLPEEVLSNFCVISHNCDDTELLQYLGTTTRNTPVWANRHFLNADLRIVVGAIEPHQIQGFSGGVKSAAIGLANRQTINHNHAMLFHPDARLGCFAENPARQDVEEIGRMIGVHFALNVILNSGKEIVKVLAGDPQAVMEKGIPMSCEINQIKTNAPYDLVIASPGGYPKDINLYQSQKALAHASMITRPGGTIILAAACPEGSENQTYEAWMEGLSTHEEVIHQFKKQEFVVGPHKAYLIARDARNKQVLLVSEMKPEHVERMLLTPVADLNTAVDVGVKRLNPNSRIAIMPRAVSTIPEL